MKAFLGEARKAVRAFTAAATAASAAGLLTGSVAVWAFGLLGSVAAGLAAYAADNG